MPAWSALIVAVPVVRKVRTPPEVMVATPVVEEVNVTVRPDVEEADRVGEVPKFCVPGLAKVIVWGALGVTADDGSEVSPASTALRALTVNV